MPPKMDIFAEEQDKISPLADVCNKLFIDCYAGSQLLDSKLRENAELQHQRFCLWASYMGVFAAAGASLDKRLQFSEDLQSLVLQLLSLVQTNLEFTIATEFKKSKRYTFSLTSIKRRLSLQGSSSDALSAVGDAIDRLNNLGSIIRRHSISNLDNRIRAFTDKHGDGNYMELAKAIVDTRFKTATSSLKDQLALSMVARHQRLRYIKRHQEKLAHIPLDTNNTPDPLPKTDVSHLSTLQSIHEEFFASTPTSGHTNHTRRVSHKETIASYIAPSATKASTFKFTQSVAAKIHKGDGLSVVSSSKMSETLMDGDLEDNYPESPKKVGDLECLCSFCSQPLKESELEIKKWRRHVDKDLQPFVCISEKCKQQQKTFDSFAVWAKHMRDAHTTKWPQLIHKPIYWRCDVDHQNVFVYENAEEFEEHLSTTHGDCTAATLKAIFITSRIPRRRAPNLCPFCGYDVSISYPRPTGGKEFDEPGELDRLAKHIATHLRRLAFDVVNNFLAQPGDEDLLSNVESSEGRKENGTEMRAPSGHGDLCHISLSTFDPPTVGEEIDQEWSNTKFNLPPPELSSNHVPLWDNIRVTLKKKMDERNPAEIDEVNSDQTIQEFSKRFIPARLWDRAYDALRIDETALMHAYEKILSHRIRNQGFDVPIAESEQNEIAQKDANERREQMWNLTGNLRRNALYKTVEDELGGTPVALISRANDAIDTKNTSAAAIPWVGIWLTLEAIEYTPHVTSIYLDGIRYIKKMADRYWNLPIANFERNTEENTFTSKQNINENQIVNLYREILLYEIKAICAIYSRRGVISLPYTAAMNDWNGNIQSIKMSERVFHGVFQEPISFSNLWARAFTEVNDATQKWIRKRGLHSSTGLAQDQIKELIKLVESNKLSEQTDEPLKIEVGNQKLIIREYIVDAVAFITMNGDAAITFAPLPASAPWAFAKAVLKIPVKHIEQKAVLLGTVQWFTRIVRRGQIYEALYNAAVADERLIQNLCIALLDVCKTALELLASLDTLFDSGIARQVLKAVLRPEGATGKVKDLYKKEQQLITEVQACEASRSAISSKQTNDDLKELKRQLYQLSSPLLRMDERVATRLEKLEERDFDELMRFISSEMFGKSHAAVRDARIEHTGDWILVNRDFRAWQEISSSSAVLCLKGTVGTGKTYLTSKVVDYVKQTLDTSQHDEGFAYFYCNRSGPSMQDPIVVLRSFVRQLAGKAFGEPGLIQSSLAQKCKAAKREGREIGYKDCKALILASLNLYSKTTIILDALDESDITTYNLCTILIEMMEESKRPVKIFISTRPDRKYLTAFRDRHIITLDVSNQQGDIERFLEEKLYSTESFMERSQEAQYEIKQVFATRSCGMFRWVYLQVRSLEKHITDDSVHKWARMLPHNLTEAYDQLWDNMRRYDDFDVDLAERAIMWVLCSIEPLKSGAFLEAIRYVAQGSTVIQKKEQTQQQILSLCQDLLTIDEERGVWMLPHPSVAEYFESRGYANWKCDEFASKVCLGVLENFESEEIGYEDGNFAYYVTEHWVEHVTRYDRWLGTMEEAKADPHLVQALERFLGSPDESSANYRKWASTTGDEFEPTNMALFAVCKYGLWYTLRDWWHSKVTMEMACEKNGYGNTSLILAVESNCLPMVKHMVDLIDVMHPDAAMNCVGALNSALEKENFDIVKLLIMEASVDVNLPDPEYGMTAAQLATGYSPATLQWMLDQGIVDMEGENNSRYRAGNVLIAAVCYGKVESVQLLLKAGANVNAAVHSGNYGSALVAAVEQMLPAIVRLLLEHGADPNLPLRVGKWGSALEASMKPEWDNRLMEKGREEIQHMLVDAGADLTAVSERGEYGSALAAAAFWGQKEILMVMIDRVGAERAIQALRQSRHPDTRWFQDEDVQRWKDTATYLGQVGVSKETLHAIGLREDIKLESTGSSYDGKYLLDYSELNHYDN